VGTGTYQSLRHFLDDCDPSIVYPAQATLWQNGSSVGRALTVTGDDPRGCFSFSGTYTFVGTRQGSVLTGTIKSPDFSWFVRGVLSGSKFSIELADAYGHGFGVMNLHR